MDDVHSGFEALKISAFKKAKQITPYVHSVTLGPDSLKKKVVEVPPAKPKHPLIQAPKFNHYKNNSIPFKKVINEYELQRQEKVQEAISNKRMQINNFNKEQDVIKKMKWMERQQSIILHVQQQENHIFKALEQHDLDSSAESEKLIAYYQEIAEKRKKNDEAIQAKEERHKKTQKVCDDVLKAQQDFRTVYLDIIQILKDSDEHVKLMLTDHIQNLKGLPAQMDEVVTKIKGNNIVEQDAIKCNELLEFAKKLHENIKLMIVTYNEKLEELKLAEIKAQEAKLAPANEPPQYEQPMTAPQYVQPSATAPQYVQPITIPTTTTEVKPATQTTIESFVSKTNFKIYSDLQTFLQNHIKSFQNLLKDESLKNYKFDCKKAVNIPVNAITAVSSSHLLDKYHKLHNLLAGKPIKIGDNQILASRHPEGIAFSMDLLANKFVLQGDLMISSNPEAAFGYAAIIIALWNDFPDFGKVILAHFQKQCPYLVPIYLPRHVEQTDEDYYKSQGYQYKDGVVEKQDKFLKRMTGIMRLFGAILITKPKSGHTQNPHNIKYGWCWLTSILNMEPRADITATLIHVFLEVCGSAMLVAYGKQFKKILNFICVTYMPMLKKMDTGGPVTRLEVLLQGYIKNGIFEIPKGELHCNFW